MSSRGRRLLAVTLLVMAAASLRFYNLTFHDLRGDEAFSVWFAQQDWRSILQNLRLGEPHPPLYYLGLKAWMSVAGTSELAARWPSAAAGIALVPLVFALGRRLRAPGTGAVAAALVAANPYLIWNSQDARMYSLATTFAAAALYWALRVGEGAGAGRGKRVAGLAVATALALYTHYVAAILVTAANGAVAFRLLYADPKGRRLREWAVAAGMAAAVFTPWLVVGLPVLGASYAGTMRSPGVVAAISDVLSFFAGGELYGPPGVWVLAAAIAGSAIVGGGWLLRHHPASGATILASLVIPFMALLIASAFRPVFSPRYLMLITPAYFSLAGAGVSAMIGVGTSRGRGRQIAATAALAVAITVAGLTAAALSSYYADRGGQGRGIWSEFVGEVVRSAKEADLVAVNHLDVSFSYYYQRLGGRAPTLLVPSRQDAHDEDLDRQFAPVATPGRVIWLVPDGMRTYDRDGLGPAWLERHAVRGEAKQAAGMELIHYRMPSAVPVGLRFGDAIRLEGYELRLGKERFAPGATVIIDLLWRALAPVTTDYIVTVQILDDTGQLAAQSDGAPAGGRSPTTTWRTTETVLDSRTLLLPDRAGSYAMAVAMYELPSVRRLQVEGDAGGLAVLRGLRIGE